MGETEFKTQKTLPGGKAQYIVRRLSFDFGDVSINAAKYSRRRFANDLIAAGCGPYCARIAFQSGYEWRRQKIRLRIYRDPCFYRGSRRTITRRGERFENRNPGIWPPYTETVRTISIDSIGRIAHPQGTFRKRHDVSRFAHFNKLKCKRNLKIQG